ncbi:hypothetical protein HOY80DRAFT_271367 [Tuber brumale]|nr:hypothetical protein HOY80DRAFT_271367 [Tuber brumale]
MRLNWAAVPVWYRCCMCGVGPERDVLEYWYHTRTPRILGHRKVGVATAPSLRVPYRASPSNGDWRIALKVHREHVITLIRSIITLREIGYRHSIQCSSTANPQLPVLVQHNIIPYIQILALTGTRIPRSSTGAPCGTLTTRVPALAAPPSINHKLPQRTPHNLPQLLTSDKIMQPITSALRSAPPNPFPPKKKKRKIVGQITPPRSSPSPGARSPAAYTVNTLLGNFVCLEGGGGDTTMHGTCRFDSCHTPIWMGCTD